MSEETSPVPTEGDRATIINEYNTTGDPSMLGKCLNQLFENSAEKHSEKTAVICGDDTCTFRELNALANRLSRALVERGGVQNGDLVGVGLDRSTDLVVMLLAVWKAGAAYIPIDPSLPAKRVQQMMEDARPRILITGDRSNKHAANDIEHLSLADLVESIRHDCDISSSSSGNVATRSVTSDDLAYVMYTSGSTGKPKGVEVTHGNVSNLLLSMQKEPGCDATDRLLAITTISFDMAVLELFLPLLCGATVVITQRHEVKDPKALIGLMVRHQITIMQGTPAIWQMLLDTGWEGQQPQLKKIFCGGEALSKQLADRLLARGDEVWNMYGPTEATVYASIWRVRRSDGVIMIGGPITNGRLYVLDEGLSPVALGSPGELYIGGAGVARGYRNNSELSRSRFLDNPFHDGLMYRTGDLARWLGPGKLVVMGRIDAQVKIRGYRIELGEIEETISKQEGISNSVVICHDDRLIAYYVRKVKTGWNRPSSTGRFDRALRSWLAERLPIYMVPAFFVEMETLPVTLNGKIDRKALPEPVLASHLPSALADREPASELEGHILDIWSRVLGHDYFGIDDNFFEIGGDSLRLVHVQKELERLLDRPVPSPKLFEHYTIESLVAYLQTSSDPAIPAPITRPFNTSTAEDIAVIATACRLPGGVTTPEEFWELLVSGGDAIIDVPKDRWEVNDMYDASLDAQSKSYCRRGGFLASINTFDASFFGISPREASKLDPTQCLMLETCWEGFERAGYTLEQLRGSQTGVFIGTSNILAHHSFSQTAVREMADLDGYAATGSAVGALSGRISYQFGLEGPTMTIDTACSSSLVTTHLACNALRQGECDLAVSGGVSLMLGPGLHIEFSRLQGMSQDGRCRSFSADTQGTGWAEGSAAVVLKRLTDAQRDGDFIHAVIRGSAVNHDGRSASLTTPSGPAQKKLIHTALAASRLQPNDIDYVEAHGTGTKLGDPIEATALAEVFGPSRHSVAPLHIGSSKSNIGHTQATAGLVGLLKVILAMQNSLLPQTLHISQPTPAVEWQRANMTPVMSNQPWLSQESRQRRAGVSAFGIGGTNSHVIVEETPRLALPTENGTATAPRLPALPFLLSGDTEASLRMQADKLRLHINRYMDQVDLVDISYSLATTRNHFRRRLVVAAGSKSELLEKLASISSSKSVDITPGTAAKTKVAVLFTGQGGQWPGMGKELCELYPVFHETIRDIAAQFTQLDPPLLEVMWAEAGGSNATLLNRTDYAQPALFALEVSLWRLWQYWAIKPEVVFGHSLGEIVAAHVAGVMNLSDACRLVEARSRLMQAQCGDSMMVSLEASSKEVLEAVKHLGCTAKADIAAYNTPTQTVISGDTDAVGRITDHFTMQGRKTKNIVSGHAFHSHHMDSMLEDFRVVAETVRYKPPQLKIICGIDGKLAETGRLEQADYWVRQVRDPVRFSDGIQSLARHGVNTFLEVGPQQILCGMGIYCLVEDENSNSTVWLPSLHPRKDNIMTLQHSVVSLHLRHASIDWPAYFSPFKCKRVALPTYAFQRDYNILPNALEALNHRRNQKVNQSIEDHEGHIFGIEWHPVETESGPSKGTWGILYPDKDTDWACSVVAAMSRSGIRLVEAKHINDGQRLDRLICLWDSQPDVSLRDADFMARALEQLQTAVDSQFSLPLVWITNRAVGTNTESHDANLQLGAAPLWGLLRTARNEHPELRLRLVDLDEGISDYVVTALMLDTEPECVVRQGQVLVPRMCYVDVVPKSLVRSQFIRPGGAVLITGGLGSLGARVAQWLAEVHHIRDLVLISRRGMKTPGAEKLVAELSNTGARVTVVAGDVSNEDSVKSIMEGFNDDRPLRGVVHAAGVVDSGVLSAMTPNQLAVTLPPKALGAWILHKATREMDLDLFVMFSSISGVMGMPGLANYAAANTFLDALAHLRRAHRLPATSIAYGVWAGDGMGSRLASTTHTHLSRFGLDALPPKEGLDLLELAVSHGRALTVAAALDLERTKGYFEEQGGVPPLLRLLINQDNKELPQAWENEVPRKTELESQRGADNMLQMVRDVVAKALGFRDPLDVDIDRPLQEIGIDSLTAVQIRNHLSTLTGLRLSVNIAFLHPNLAALSSTLELQLRDSETLSTMTSSSSATSATSVSGSSYLDIKAVRKGCLDSDITFDNVARSSVGSPTRPKSVFLTGGTGFVGAFILHELLGQGITTYCLVRANGADEARHRVVTTLNHYGLWEASFSSLLEPVVGDMAQPLLGLNEELFDDLADRVGAICHSGGLVDWMQPLENYVGPNIVSTHEILRLASRGRAKTIHLVSTISTLPKHMGLDLTEEDQEWGYGTSKYIAEMLVAAARWRGAEACVYRLPYVTASSTTGHFRLDRGDFFHNFITGCLDMGAFPSADADMSAALPVDYLSRTIVAVMTKDFHQIGHDYDFLNARAPTCQDYFEMIGKATGGKEVIAFDTWKQRALDYARAHPKSSIARISAILDSHTGKTAATIFKGSFMVGKNILGGNKYPAPAIDEHYIRAYLSRIKTTAELALQTSRFELDG